MAELSRDALENAIRRKVERPLHATLVGDHLRGWQSEKSPYRVSGAMVIPVRELLGLRPARETKERMFSVDGRDVDLHFHDVRRYLDDIARMANTRALEELYSPYIVFAGPEHEQLRRIAWGFLTRNTYHDWLERGALHRRRVLEGETLKVWELLESARLFLSGTHVLRAAELEANLGTLIERYETWWLRPFLHRQQTQGEAAALTQEEVKLLRYDLEALEMRLHAAHDHSVLPEGGGSITTLDEFLIALRFKELDGERTRDGAA